MLKKNISKNIFSVITTNSNWEISPANLVTFIKGELGQMGAGWYPNAY